MNGKLTYHQQVSYCGKPHCRKCRDGTGHGPYWYAYQTVDGRTTRTYVGKHLPTDVQAAREKTQITQLSSAIQTSEREQATIHIYALGQFRLERRNDTEWQTVTDSAWQQQRVRALLSCLISASSRKLGREQLLETIWPDLDTETAGHRLDRSVYNLRQIFEPARSKLATSPLLLTEREVLVLAKYPLIWIDADAFEHLIAQAHDATDSDATERLLETAATLYGGDFLPEEQTLEWVVARREKLQRSWVGLLIDLADLRIAHNALSKAIDPLDRLLSIDPTNEAAVQRLMRVLAQLGRRGEALRAYKRLASALQQEYRIAPLPETRAIYEAVRQDSAYEKAASGRTTSNIIPKASEANADTAQRGRLTSEIAIQIGRMHQSPLVGREQELALLRSLVIATETMNKFKLQGQKRIVAAPFDAQHRPQSILLMGEVGIGKTRLAEEVGREARRRGWAVAWSRVYAQEGGIPYRLWVEVLRKAIEQSRYGSTALASSSAPPTQIALPPQIAQKPNFYQPLSTLLPELEGLLPEGIFAPSPPEQEQLRLWEATRELLTSISEGTPLLIVLDDLQWADGSSCELLAYLARRIHGYPIIIIGTCRDNELSETSPLRPLPTDLQREHAMETISLKPLSDEQITALITQILTDTQNATSSSPPPTQPAQPVFSYIQNRAAGNPFFAEELARALAPRTLPADGVGTRFIASAGEGPTIAGGRDKSGPYDDNPTTTTMPETITAVLDLRLSHLSPACRRILSKAAVLGGSFEFPIICSMEANTPGSDEDTVLEIIEEALYAGMLTEEGIGTRITYQFWHPLLVSHLYESLSAARRASLHRRAAEILLKIYATREEEGAATVSYHLVHGGADSDQITHYTELAGNRAYALSAYPDAEKHYRLTFEHMSTHPDEQLHRASILELLGECVRIQGKYEEARHFYEQALDVRRQQSKHVIDSQKEAQIQALFWYEIARTWYDTGDIARSRHYCERGEQVLREASVLAGPAWAKLRYQQSYISWREGHYEVADHAASEALNLLEQAFRQQEHYKNAFSQTTRIRRTLAGDLVDLGRTQMLLGLIANGAGRSNNALDHFTAALTLYEQNSCQREIAIVSCNLGDLYLRKADYTQAKAILRRSLNIAERIGELPLVSYAIGNLGVLDLRMGNLVDAETELRRGIVFSERIDDPISLSFWYTYLATAMQEQGRLSEAKGTLGRALIVSRTTHIAPIIGLTLVAVGSLRIAQTIIVDLDGENLEEKESLLRHAKKTLQHALTREGIEAETRIEGLLAQVQAQLQLQEVESAYQQAQQTLQEARQSELTWLVARAQRILGCILVIKEEQEQATKHFEQALRTFRKCGMRLEYGRTLQQYGCLLLQQGSANDKSYERGLTSLQEARQLFIECQAQLDLQSIEHVINEHEGIKST